MRGWLLSGLDTMDFFLCLFPVHRFSEIAAHERSVSRRKDSRTTFVTSRCLSDLWG